MIESFQFIFVVNRNQLRQSRINTAKYRREEATNTRRYCLILESSGYRTGGFAYLIYYWPAEVRENGVVKFNVRPMKIETKIESAKETFQDAVRVLRSPIPKAAGACDYCALVAQRKI